MKKRIFAIIIIVVLLISVTPEKAEAFAPALAVEGVKVIVMALLAALGVTALNDDALMGAVTEFISDLTAGAQELMDEVDFKVYTGSFTQPRFGSYIGPAGWLVIPEALWDYAREYVDTKYDAGLNIDESGDLEYGNVYLIDDLFGMELYRNNVAIVRSLLVNSDIEQLTNGIGTVYNIGVLHFGDMCVERIGSLGNSYYEIEQDTGWVKLGYEMNVYGVPQPRIEIYDGQRMDNVIGIGRGYVRLGSYPSTGILGKEGYIDDPGRDWEVKDENGKPMIPFIPNLAKIVRSIGELIDADFMKERYVGLEVDDLPKEVEGIEITEENIEDIAVEDYFEWEEGIEEGSSLKALFFSKFPFCLPWDIKNLFTLLAAPAEAPNFQVDIYESVRDKYGIHGDTTISFDMGKYEIFGKVSRITSLIGFCLVLIMITRKIIRS